MDKPGISFSIKWAKENVSKILLTLTVIFVGAFFYILNVLYPIYLDDWFYSFSFFAENERINSFFSIFQSQYNHYFEWGGRNVVHVIAQLLLWAGETWGNVFNTLAYVALTMCIYFIANRGNKPNILLFILINILIWFTLPAFSQNLLWITGSANYLWGGLIVLVFAYPYVSYYYKQEESSSIFRNISFAFLGILAGWTNENMGVALIFFLIGVGILLKIRKLPIPTWMIFGLVGVVIGFLMMISAPGNFMRNKLELMAVHKMSEITPSFYFYRFVTVFKLSCIYLLIPVLIYILLLVLYCWKGKREHKKETLYLSLLFFTSSAIATMAMSGSPVFPERAWFGIIILLIVSISILYAHIDFTPSALRIVNYSIIGILSIVYLYSWAENYTELDKFNQVCESRQLLIEKEKAKGIKDIVITDAIFEEKDSKLIVLNLKDWLILERDGWAERVGRYNGVNTIKIYESQERSK
ncbi:MAG: DUF6056 family protein [Prevotella sp.]|jgi:hypothetical protein|nr:DUF6056 family protein [Prevotella sp.]